jgi:hypothetical protein
MNRSEILQALHNMQRLYRYNKNSIIIERSIQGVPVHYSRRGWYIHDRKDATKLPALVALQIIAKAEEVAT